METGLRYHGISLNLDPDAAAYELRRGGPKEGLAREGLARPKEGLDREGLARRCIIEIVSSSSVGARRYDSIVPCGLDPVHEPVGALSARLGRVLTPREAAPAFLEAFADVFEAEIVVDAKDLP